MLSSTSSFLRLFVAASRSATSTGTASAGPSSGLLLLGKKAGEGSLSLVAPWVETPKTLGALTAPSFRALFTSAPASVGLGVDLPGKGKAQTNSRTERLAAAHFSSSSSSSAATGAGCSSRFCACAKAGTTTHQLVPTRSHYHISEDDGAEKIQVIFVDRDGDEYDIQAPVGRSLLEIAHAHDIELEGACEGSLACSTCHVIVEDEDQYDLLEEPSDDENDMLDLAFGLTETSRLGCQIICAPELDGLRVRIPGATRNFAVDGFVPKPH